MDKENLFRNGRAQPSTVMDSVRAAILEGSAPATQT